MIIVIAGPTASGKTDVSIGLAEYLDTDIINCDSKQIYKFMNIGTAKPSAEQRRSVKHHMFDIIYPDEYFNSVMYTEKARDLANTILKDKKHVILAGGSGFYISNFLYGLSQLPVISSAAKELVHKKLQENSRDELYDELRRIDPDYSKNISINDKYRIKRFFEIFYTVKCPPSKYFAYNPAKALDIPFIVFYLEKDRKDLYLSIDRRVDSMMENGLVSEVNSLLKKGYDKKFRSMNTIGYSEIIDFLDGKISQEMSVELIKTNTRRYAKRQIIWFRKMKEKIIVYSLKDIIKYLSSSN